MATDDPFEPKLGKIRAQRPKSPKAYVDRVLHATRRAGGLKLGGRGGVGAGKSGRGNGVARVIASSGSTTVQTRRVVVKVRFVKLAGRGLKAAFAHTSYLQRDGVTREGQAGQFYGRETDQLDAKDFMEKSAGDRHQFRFIIAPEDGHLYDDLKAPTRKLMAQMEIDLGTRLEWGAVDHYNTGHPHVHIVVRGKTEFGDDLVIAPEYLSEGIRTRSSHIVTRDLGPRSELEIATARQAEVAMERLTSIDRRLLRDADHDLTVAVGHKDATAHALRAGRLAKLKSLGLADKLDEGRWRLRSDMERTLRSMGERSDIIKIMHRELTRRGLEAAISDSVIHRTGEPAYTGTAAVTGRLISREFMDETNDRHCAVIEATDGRVHVVDLGVGSRINPMSPEAIIRLTPKTVELKTADHAIMKVAEANGGLYSVDMHLAFDRNARQAFAETHERRLEAIRRSAGGVEREADGTFKIGADYLDRALDYERRDVRRSPVNVEVLSEQTLEVQVRRNGVTWLDSELASEERASFGHAGFAGEVRQALQQRQAWLVQEGLISDARVLGLLPTSVLHALHQREITSVAAALSSQTGLPYRESYSGDLIEGRLKQSVQLGMGKYAVVERARDFTLVPWRPVLEKHVGKSVVGIMRDSGINWKIERSKDLGIE